MVKMGYVWDRTVETLGDRLSVVVPIAIVGIFLPSTILTSLEGLRAGGGFGVKMGLSLVSLAFSLLSLWAQLSIIAAATDPRRTAADAARVGVSRLLPAIGIFLLLLVAAVVVFLPAFFLLGSGGIDPAALQSGQVSIERFSGGMVGAAMLYGLVFFIAFVFVGARLVPLSAVLVEERRGVGAIGRAFRLTRGLTWRLVGVLVLYAVVTMVAVLAVQTVFGTVLRLFDGGTGPITLTGVLTAIATSAVSAAFTVLATVFCARLYIAVAGSAGGPVVARDSGDAGPHIPGFESPDRP